MNTISYIWGSYFSSSDPDQELSVDEECGPAHLEGNEDQLEPATRSSGWGYGMGWIARWRSPLRAYAIEKLVDESAKFSKDYLMERYLVDQTGLDERACGDTPAELGDRERCHGGGHRKGGSDGSGCVRFNSSVASGHDTQGMQVGDLQAFETPQKPLFSVALPTLGFKFNLILQVAAVNQAGEADLAAHISLLGWSVGLRTSNPAAAEAVPDGVLLC